MTKQISAQYNSVRNAHLISGSFGITGFVRCKWLSIPFLYCGKKDRKCVDNRIAEKFAHNNLIAVCDFKLDAMSASKNYRKFAIWHLQNKENDFDKGAKFLVNRVKISYLTCYFSFL